MKLHELRSSQTKQSRKRRGQGNGSGNGTYAGRGCKGQNCRSGGGVRLGFEGGQSTLLQRMPKKRGFRNPNRVVTQPVNIAKLDTVFNDGDTVSFETLLQKKLINKDSAKVKILAFGELSKKLTIAAGILISGAAAEAIKKAGGTLESSK